MVQPFLQRAESVDFVQVPVLSAGIGCFTRAVRIGCVGFHLPFFFWKPTKWLFRISSTKGEGSRLISESAEWGKGSLFGSSLSSGGLVISGIFLQSPSSRMTFCWYWNAVIEGVQKAEGGESDFWFQLHCRAPCCRHASVWQVSVAALTWAVAACLLPLKNGALHSRATETNLLPQEERGENSDVCYWYKALYKSNQFWIFPTSLLSELLLGRCEGGWMIAVLYLCTKAKSQGKYGESSHKCWFNTALILSCLDQNIPTWLLVSLWLSWLQQYELIGVRLLLLQVFACILRAKEHVLWGGVFGEGEWFEFGAWMQLVWAQAVQQSSKEWIGKISVLLLSMFSFTLSFPSILSTRGHEEVCVLCVFVFMNLSKLEHLSPFSTLWCCSECWTTIF